MLGEDLTEREIEALFVQAPYESGALFNQGYSIQGVTQSGLLFNEGYSIRGGIQSGAVFN